MGWVLVFFFFFFLSRFCFTTMPLRLYSVLNGNAVQFVVVRPPKTAGMRIKTEEPDVHTYARRSGDVLISGGLKSFPSFYCRRLRAECVCMGYSMRRLYTAAADVAVATATNKTNRSVGHNGLFFFYSSPFPQGDKRGKDLLVSSCFKPFYALGNEIVFFL